MCHYIITEIFQNCHIGFQNSKKQQLVTDGNSILILSENAEDKIVSLQVKEAVFSSMFKFGWDYFSMILKTAVLFLCKIRKQKRNFRRNFCNYYL